MSTETRRPTAGLSRFIAWIAPAVAALVIAAKLAGTGSSPLTNPDTYFHLRFGREFARTWRPWDPGPLDRYGSAEWRPTQWLSQLGMYGVEHLFGLAGVAVLTTAVIALLLIIWYASARRACDPLPAILLTTLALIASSGSLSARPQVLSFVLETWTVVAWSRAAESGRIPWFLVPLGWLWAMLHGMWILGGVTCLVLAGGLVADRRLPPRALLVGAASMAAALVTPVGPGIAAAVFQVDSRSAYIPEWSTPDFTSFAGATGIAVIGLAVLLFVRAHHASWHQLAAVGLGTIFTLYSLRTLPLGVCVVIPVVAPALQSAIGPRLGVPRAERVFAGLAGVVVVVAVAVMAPQRASQPPSYSRDFDVQLTSLRPGTPVLTDLADGGPFLWTHPELDFPFHGYVDVYTDRELTAYADMFALQPGWDRTLDGLGISHALLPVSSPLAYALTERGWTIGAAHDGREFLTAPAPTNPNHSSHY